MKTIGILAPLTGLQGMLDALGEVFDVRFIERMFGEDSGIDAWILQETDPQLLLTISQCKRPCYTIVCGSLLVPCGESHSIEFSRHHALPPVIRGRQIEINEIAGLKALPNWLQNVTPLASKGGAPIWAIQEADGHVHHFVSLPIPELNDGRALFQYFYGGQFLSLLPLLIFLSILTEEQQWEPPPLQACFMFDDPNLHWLTYGFIDFAEMTRHAKLHNYHVAFATIPLDVWFTHMPTAALFKQHPDRISLLIHGNNHITEELARACSDKECDLVLREALRRITELERRSGLEISKVMAPPHGACSEQFLQKMGHVGFEAACISRWSLRHYNNQAMWLKTSGMRPSDVIEGLTVFSRFRMSRTCQNSILVAALLHQPIIPVGHHYDVAEGLQLLDDLSGFINSLGPVHWANMNQISRSHYSRRYDGRILRVRVFTKRIEILIPEGINQVFVERSWPEGTEYEPLAWRVLGEKLEWNFQQPDESIPAQSGQIIEIRSVPTFFLMDGETSRKLHLWPAIRRLLTEARDRIAPALSRFSSRTNPRQSVS
jgi:hypothetical protein